MGQPLGCWRVVPHFVSHSTTFPRWMRWQGYKHDGQAAGCDDLHRSSSPSATLPYGGTAAPGTVVGAAGACHCADCNRMTCASSAACIALNGSASWLSGTE